MNKSSGDPKTDALGEGEKNSVFTDWSSLRPLLERLRAYLEALQPEFRANYEGIAEQQLRAEAARGAEREKLPSEIRQKIEQLEYIKGLLADEDQNGFHGHYRVPYQKAVQLMVRNTAGDRRPELEQLPMPLP